MARRKKPVPKSQAELSSKGDRSRYWVLASLLVPNSKKRENQRSVKGDDTKEIHSRIKRYR